MKKRVSYQVVTTGLFVAIGLILPYFTSHAFAVPGTLLLPMHIPILLCGLLCGPAAGAVTGVAVPFLSSVLTGMPAFYPMLPIMLTQLLAMGLLSGLLYRKLGLPLYAALIAAMASGWALYGLAFGVMMFATGGAMQALSVPVALARGIPGIVIQLTLIPALVAAVDRYRRGKRTNDRQSELLEEARGLIKSGGVSCVVIQGGMIIHTADGRGVKPLLELYRDEPDKLKNAFVVDKIIGKAAAMILVLGGASRVHGEIMSVAARDYLAGRKVTAGFGRCVDVITNRDETGICPIEKSVLDIDDPQKGLEHITRTIAKLMRQVV